MDAVLACGTTMEYVGFPFDRSGQDVPKESRFRLADLGKPLRRSANGAVMLSQAKSARRLGPFGHESSLDEGAHHHFTPTGGGCIGQLVPQLPGQVLESALQGGDDGTPPGLIGHPLENFGQKLRIPLREQGFPGRGQVVGERGSPHATLLAPVLDNSLGLELTEVVTGGIEREAELGGEIARSQRPGALESDQGSPPRAAISAWQRMVRAEFGGSDRHRAESYRNSR
jgi:hypothetical protein